MDVGTLRRCLLRIQVDLPSTVYCLPSTFDRDQRQNAKTTKGPHLAARAFRPGAQQSDQESLPVSRSFGGTPEIRRIRRRWAAGAGFCQEGNHFESTLAPGVPSSLSNLPDADLGCCHPDPYPVDGEGRGRIRVEPRGGRVGDSLTGLFSVIHKEKAPTAHRCRGLVRAGRSYQ
jgi:hypothetical protein